MARPVGTRKREHAEAAAKAVLRGEPDDIRAAAILYFHRHAGGEPREKIVEGHAEFDRFNDFVAYVEEAYRDLINDPKNHCGALRHTYGPLNERTVNRRRQPSERRKFMAAFKADAIAMFSRDGD